MKVMDEDWEYLRKRVTSPTSEKAPPFLWTRILSRIEALEAQRMSWWGQWRWMAEVTAAVAILVLLGIGFVSYLSASGPALETILRGGTVNATIRLSSSQPPTSQEVTAWLLEGDKQWADD